MAGFATTGGSRLVIHPSTVLVCFAPVALVLVVGGLLAQPVAVACCLAVAAMVLAVSCREYAAIMLLVFIPLDVYLDPIFVSELLLACIGVGMVAGWIAGGRRSGVGFGRIVVLLYACAVTLSLIANPVSSTGLKDVTKSLLYALAFWLGSDLEISETFVLRFVKAFALLSGMAAAYGLWQFIGGSDAKFLDTVLNIHPTESFLGTADLPRAHSTFRYVLQYGQFLCVSGVVLIAWVTRGPRSGRKTMIMTLVLIVTALVFTFARSAWAGFVGAIVLLFLSGSQTWRKRAVIAFSVLAVVTTLFLAGSVTSGTIGGSVLDLRGDLLRVQLWFEGSQLIMRHPWLGVGPGNLGAQMPALSFWGKRTSVLSLENMYLTCAAETGIPSLILMVILLFRTVWIGLTMSEQASNVAYRALAAGISVGVVSQMITGMTDPILPAAQNGILLFLMMGLQEAIFRFNGGCPSKDARGVANLWQVGGDVIPAGVNSASTGHP